MSAGKARIHKCELPQVEPLSALEAFDTDRLSFEQIKRLRLTQEYAHRLTFNVYSRETVRETKRDTKAEQLEKLKEERRQKLSQWNSRPSAQTSGFRNAYGLLIRNPESQPANATLDARVPLEKRYKIPTEARNTLSTRSGQPCLLGGQRQAEPYGWKIGL